jgi:hypothetical protein
MGPLCLLDEHGEDTEPLLLTAAAALLYEHESDKGWQEIKDSKTPTEILSEICGLPAGSKLSGEVLKKYDIIKAYMNGEGKLI